MSTISIVDQANAALDLAIDEPQAAMALAETAREAATRAGLDAGEAIALRALGLAARSLQEISASQQYLNRAVAAAQRSGDVDLEAECLVSLASALVFGGEGDRALETLDLAAPGPRVAVLVASQRAGILAMLGRYDEALGYYDRVVRALRRSGERLLESRALNNRGLLHVHAGRFHQADLDLVRAEHLAADLGNLVQVASCCHNRGFAAARRGDLPMALTLFDRAEQVKVEAGASIAVLTMSRAEALVAAGLVGEARELLERSIQTMRSGGERFVQAEGLALLADAAHLAGDFEASSVAAGEAMSLFAEQSRWGAHALAAAAVGRAGLKLGTASLESAEAASAAAAALEGLGLATAGLAAHAVAGKLWLALGDGMPGEPGQLAQTERVQTKLAQTERAQTEPAQTELAQTERAQTELARAAAGRRRGPAADRAVAWDAEAVRRLSTGDRRGAQTALRAAIAVVDTQQAALSATELRAHISLHADGSAALGLRLAIESGRPRQILGWMERRRANSLRSWPLRPPRDEKLARDLAELRRLATEVTSAAAGGGDPRPLARQATRIERRVRERAWQVDAHLPGAPATGPAVDSLANELGNWALVELADSGGDLHAVVVAGGRCRHRRLGRTSAAVDELEHLRFGLRRAAYAMLGPESAADVLAKAADRLDRLLLAPLRSLIGDRSVVVVPTGPLHAVPWSTLPTLAGRPVTVSPSASAWLRASQSPPGKGKVLGVAGPGLPAASSEVKALSKIYPGAEILTGRRSTVSAVLSRLEGAAVANIAAHATFNADNGLWSALRLADGPLTVYELEGLTRTPALVVLSACQSGLSTVRSGDEVLGLVAALLALGTRTVIASVLPVDDHATAPLMLAFHTRVAAGDSPAVALCRAQAEAADPVVAVSFVCFGAS